MISNIYRTIDIEIFGTDIQNVTMNDVLQSSRDIDVSISNTELDVMMTDNVLLYKDLSVVIGQMIKGEEGPPGPQGPKGDKGDKGEVENLDSITIQEIDNICI